MLLELHFTLAQKTLLPQNTDSIYSVSMLAEWDVVALQSLISTGSLFSLLVIKGCDTLQLKCKVLQKSHMCIHMNVYFR